MQCCRMTGRVTRSAPLRHQYISLPHSFFYCPQFLSLWTVLQFGWRIFSRQAIDFRKKDAQQRMRLYLSRALFLTLEKLDFQFEVNSFEYA